MVDSLILFFLLCQFFLGVAVSGFFRGLIFFSFFMSLTKFSSYAVFLILLSIIYGLSFKIISFSRKNIILFLFYFITLSICIIMAIYNGSDTYHILGKISRVFIITFFLFASWNIDSEKYYLSNIFLFIIISSISSVVLYSVGYYGEGMFNLPRVSGFLYDPNYFALILLCLYAYMDFNKSIRFKLNYKIILSLMILLTQSWSVIVIFIAYNTLNFAIIGRYINRFMIAFSTFFIFIILKELSIGLIEYNLDWNESYLSLKINSLLLRFNTMILGYEHISNDTGLMLFGMGSGRTLEIADRVFHNLYFQQLFDHGVIYVSIFSLMFYFYFKKHNNKDYINSVGFIMMINNFLFDNIYSFIFSFMVVLFQVNLMKGK